MLKLTETDNGNCRVYYKDGRKLYCFQEDKAGEFSFYTCSRDGEPESPVKGNGLESMPHVDYLPTDYDSTSRAFRQWFKTYYRILVR